MSSWNKSVVPRKPTKLPNTILTSKQPFTPIIEDRSMTNVSLLSNLSTTSFSKDILLDSYDLFLERYTQFKKTNNDAIITFIIPSINRNTLRYTLESLEKQTTIKWKAIILFDGCLPNNDLKTMMNKNERFLYLSIQKLGSVANGTNRHGSAGMVRNIGMTLVTTPWIGFVDDDDTLMPHYVQSLEEEVAITPTCEFIIFRMVSEGIILPPRHCVSIGIGGVGISFCMKRSLFEDKYIQFQQSGVEDYQLIKYVYDMKYKIVISPHVCYLVRNSTFIHETALTRFVIH